MNPVTFYSLFFGMAALFGIGVSAVAYILYRIVDLGRRWILEIPDAPGAFATIKRKRLKPGAEYERPHEVKGQRERIKVDTLAHYPTMRGPLHLVHKETGHSLIAPRLDEIPTELRPEDLKPQPKAPTLYDEARGTEEERAKMKLANAKLKRDYDAALATWTTETTKTKASNESKALTFIRMKISTPLLYWKAIRNNDWQDWLDTQNPKEDWRVKALPVVCMLAIVAIAAFCWIAYLFITEGQT